MYYDKVPVKQLRHKHKKSGKWKSTKGIRTEVQVTRKVNIVGQMSIQIDHVKGKTYNIKS